MATARDSLRVAMRLTGMSVDEVREMCFQRFATRKFSELEEHEQWTLVCMIDSDVEGPYGQTMKPF